MRIRELARGGRWELTTHAVESLVGRDPRVDDVFIVLTTAAACQSKRVADGGSPARIVWAIPSRSSSICTPT